MTPKHDDVKKTARQRLAEVIKYLREERGLSRQRVADMASASNSDVHDWESGKAIPSQRHWDKLKSLVHRRFAEFNELWRQAGQEASDEVLQRETLTQRPFAAVLAKAPPALVPEPSKLTIVPEPPPAPPAPPEPAIPPTLVGEDFDLSRAYVATQRLPAGWRSAEAVAERTRYARELLKQGRAKAVVVRMVREQFTVGVGLPIINGLLEELEAERAAAEHAARPRKPPEPKPEPKPEPAPPPEPRRAGSPLEAVEYARMLFRKAWSMKDAEMNRLLQDRFGVELPADKLAELRTEGKRARASAEAPAADAPAAQAPPAASNEVAAPAPAPKVIVESEVQSAVELVLEAIPNLRTFVVQVDDAGEVVVSFTVREVKVTESGGSLKLKR